MRSIDADKLKDRIMTSFGKYKETAKGLCEIVDAQPTLDTEKWISPEERLPETSENVLIKCRLDEGYGVKTIVTIAYRLSDDQWKEINQLFGYIYSSEIEGWMPLPKV